MSDLVNYIVKDIVSKIENMFKDFSLKTDEKIKTVEDMVKSIEVPTPDISHLEKRVDDAIKAIPEVKDGKDGQDGESVSVDDLLEELQNLVKEVEVPTPDISHLEKRVDEAIKAIPEVKNGEDGKSVTVEDLLPVVKDLVKSVEVPEPDISHLEKRVDDAIKAIPEVKNGEDGKSVTVEEVLVGMEGHFAKWALDFERRAQDTLQKACEKIPKPKDAFELEDLDVKLLDDERTVVVSFDNGERKVEKSFKLSVPIHKGVYKASEEHSKGDAVTFGGSLWIAQKDAPQGKPGQSEDWMLSVKKGRDGRESVKIEREIDKVKVTKDGNAG